MNYHELIKSKIYSREALLKQIAVWKLKDEKIVFTNGCFDILHLGHVEYLSKAAGCGTKLIVAVNSDDSVKRLGKSTNRPIQDESSRAFIIASLQVVSAVIIFNEDTPYELISIIKPDVLVKGNDYKVEQIAGHDIVLKNGGEVKLIELTPGYSTTAIENKIKKQ